MDSLTNLTEKALYFRKFHIPLIPPRNNKLQINDDKNLLQCQRRSQGKFPSRHELQFHWTQFATKISEPKNIALKPL